MRIFQSAFVSSAVLFVAGMIGFAGERFEGKIWPVVKPAVVMSVEPGTEGAIDYYDIMLQIEKVRGLAPADTIAPGLFDVECEYKSLQVISVNGVPYQYFYVGPRRGNHPLGKWATGPWRVLEITPNGIGEMRIFVKHQCSYRWWQTTTEITPEWGVDQSP